MLRFNLARGTDPCGSRRGRGIGRGFLEVYGQYGREGGDANLGSVGTMVFLARLDDNTAKYAAVRIGTMTVLQRTSVDATGTKYDNERLAEVSRDLLDHAELRQLVRHTQAVAIIDTAPPIKFRFPPLAIGERRTRPVQRKRPNIISLAEAEGRMKSDAMGDGGAAPTVSDSTSLKHPRHNEDKQPGTSGGTKIGGTEE